MTEEEEKLVRFWYAEGMDPKVIAETFGLDEKEVINYFTVEY